MTGLTCEGSPDLSLRAACLVDPRTSVTKPAGESPSGCSCCSLDSSLFSYFFSPNRRDGYTYTTKRTKQKQCWPNTTDKAIPRANGYDCSSPSMTNISLWTVQINVGGTTGRCSAPELRNTACSVAVALLFLDSGRETVCVSAFLKPSSIDSMRCSRPFVLHVRRPGCGRSNRYCSTSQRHSHQLLSSIRLGSCWCQPGRSCRPPTSTSLRQHRLLYCLVVYLHHQLQIYQTWRHKGFARNISRSRDSNTRFYFYFWCCLFGWVYAIAGAVPGGSAFI